MDQDVKAGTPSEEGGTPSEASGDSLRSSKYPLRALVKAGSMSYSAVGLGDGVVAAFKGCDREGGTCTCGGFWALGDEGTEFHFYSRELIFDPTPEQIAEERAKAGLPPSPAPVPGLPSSDPLLGEMVEALRQIADAESNHCNRCDGGGRVWADGKAHSQGYSGPMMACSNCGGAGETDSVDLREIARAAISKYEARHAA